MGLQPGGICLWVSFPLGSRIRFGAPLALLWGAGSPWGLWLGDLLFLRGEGPGEGGLFWELQAVLEGSFTLPYRGGAVGVLESSDLEGGVGLSLSWWAMVGGGVCSLGASSSG